MAEDRSPGASSSGGPGWPPNLQRLLDRHPTLEAAFGSFAAHVKATSCLTVHQQILIGLRVAALRDAPYEWAHLVAAAAETPPETIVAIAAGSEEPGWSAEERALLQAVDQLIVDAKIDDRTQASLRAFLSDEQQRALVYTVGFHNLTAMATKTFGLPADDLPDPQSR